MPNSLESALIIELTDSLKWSAALPPVNTVAGTLTPIDPGQPFDVTKYARRDREFQHRDMVNAAAVAKVSIFARTVWNGTVVQPVLQGVTDVTQNGTNVVLPLDPTQVGTSLPNSSTAVQYVLNADVAYTAVRVTDVNLYNRDLLLYESLARAAAIFPVAPPISEIDPSGTYIGSTPIWATAYGTDTPKVPNAAEPMNQATLKDPDLYLAERDNQVAAYVSRIAQALKNPFEYAARIYVKINSAGGSDSSESETYVLTDNSFVQGSTYTAGIEVLYRGAWYRANNTTTNPPPSVDWTAISNPTQLQFLAEPTLDARNRIVYDRSAKTLQWFRETLDMVHVPQIVGFLIPGILPGQTIETVPTIPERKDAQFYRQKSGRMEFSSGTYSSKQVFNPTGNRDSTSTYVTGATNTLFQDTKRVTLPMPDSFTVNWQDLSCSSGTYAMNCLVRPCPQIQVAGGDNDQGSVDTTDGGTSFSSIGDVRNWEVALPAGGWKLFIEFSNVSATSTSFFGIKASQGATTILANTLPIYYTDAQGNALPQSTVISSPGIDLQSTGQVYNFNIQWTSGNGQLHISKLTFRQVNAPDTSHYIMQASWLNGQGTLVPAVSSLDVIGKGNTPDVMPFIFHLTGSDTQPQVTVEWLPKSGSAWIAQAYRPGDQVLFNLIYWQANNITTSADIPGQSPLWDQLGREPQIPLVFEQIELSKLVSTSTTPETQGFQSFRQDMLERALRADQDAYSKALFQVGTNFPVFRENSLKWTPSSTESWMRFMEVYAPRLRFFLNVASGSIVGGRQYQVIAADGESVTYDSENYTNGQKFYGVAGVSTFSITGVPIVNQVGAYYLSKPGDIGKTGLVPAGVEYIISAGTGTVAQWYPSYASYPTHQAVQPWMIESGFYVASDDFQSPDGNPVPLASGDDPFIPPAPPFDCAPFADITLSAAIDNSTPAPDRPGSYAYLHNFTCTAGQAVNIWMRSVDFNSYLFVRDPNGNVVLEDDASGWVPPDDAEDSPAAYFRPAMSGVYVIEFTTFDPATTGNFIAVISAGPGPEIVGSTQDIYDAVYVESTNVIFTTNSDELGEHTLAFNATTGAIINTFTNLDTMYGGAYIASQDRVFIVTQNLGGPRNGLIDVYSYFSDGSSLDTTYDWDADNENVVYNPDLNVFFQPQPQSGTGLWSEFDCTTHVVTSGLLAHNYNYNNNVYVYCPSQQCYFMTETGTFKIYKIDPVTKAETDTGLVGYPCGYNAYNDTVSVYDFSNGTFYLFDPSDYSIVVSAVLFKPVVFSTVNFKAIYNPCKHQLQLATANVGLVCLNADTLAFENDCSLAQSDSDNGNLNVLCYCSVPSRMFLVYPGKAIFTGTQYFYLLP